MTTQAAILLLCKDLTLANRPNTKVRSLSLSVLVSAPDTMPIEITEIHKADDAKKLNSEWFILRNDTDKVFAVRKCSLESGRKGSKKTTSLGMMDPGFSLAPGESVRVITGNPGKKSHGKLPEDDTKNYSLFLGAPIFKSDGATLTLRLRQLALASVEFNSAADKGIAASSP